MQLETAKIRLDRGSLSAKDIEIYSDVLMLVPADSDLESLPYASELRARMRRADCKLGDAKPFVTQLPNAAGTRLALGGIRPDTTAFELLTLARHGLSALFEPRPERLAIGVVGLERNRAAAAAEAALAAALAADFDLPDYKTGTKRKRTLREIALYGNLALDMKRVLASARGNNLARYLTALPPNELTPATYRKRVERLARDYGWKVEFHDLAALRKRGAGAFVAVAQGSPEPDAGLLRLRYAPKRKRSRPLLALVGKGICFDTGGTNLKSAKHMHGMHEDMEGSAVALGTLLALTEMGADFPVDCWLALAQNHIGPKSYRQNEVVTAANGTTIEIMHTDAEGRMVLADALYFAAKEQPKLIVDYATLTGACIGALSTRLSGALTNRAELIPALIRAGEESGERVWPFPLPADFAEALKSDIADVKQCTLENDADQILAAVFLKRFLVNDPDWVHLDLAAGNHKGGLAHVPTDITGFGVRFTLELLLGQELLG